MAAYLLTGFDATRLGGLSVFVDDALESDTVSLTGTYAHRDLSSVMGTGNYVSLAAALQAAINAATPNPGTDPGTVTWSATTGLYTIAFPDGITLDFTSATLGDNTGKALAAALGLNYLHPQASGGSSSDPYNVVFAGDTSIVSNVVPYYYLALARDGVSGYSRDFYSSGQTKRVVSAKANAYTMRPHTKEKRTRFTMRFNTLASVFASEASASAPWTYEDLVEHAGCAEPILLSYSEEDLVYRAINGDFDEDARRSVWGDYHGKWDLPVEAQILGRI